MVNYEQILESNNIDVDSIERGIPGEILVINKQYGIIINSIDYPIRIVYAQLEGKNSTDSYTLSAQCNLSTTNIFGS